MNPLWPTPGEAATLRFLVSMGPLRTRALAALTLFGVGAMITGFAPPLLVPLGLGLILLGHLPLWVRSQTIAPGGSTPAHEELWAPVEDEWLERVEKLEKRGARWDATPWDISNGLGCLALLALLGALAAVVYLVIPMLGTTSALRLAAGAVLLFLPLWLNGMRTTWNPSELRKKGQALAVAREEAERLAKGDFDSVPTLALREGRRGKYPVDARLMLRPSREDTTGFLGVQVQVALNNVQGTDYPYLYAVVLGKDAFRLPRAEPRLRAQGVDLVCEPGKSEGVRYLVIRQHADKKGGWHTEPHHIRAIVTVAIEKARAAWRESGGKTP